MRLKCDDGQVRTFSIAFNDGDHVGGGLRSTRDSEAYCEDCGEPFGVHDLKILKPKFRAHSCVKKPEKK